MTDTARVLLTAAILSGATLSAFAWRIVHIEAELPDRLIGELRLAQWAAVFLAAVGAIHIGLAIAATVVVTANADAAIGVIVVGIAGISLQREPRESLLLVSVAFMAHALVDLAHRPGWLSPAIEPRWFTIGCAVYNVYLAGLCFWARRR